MSSATRLGAMAMAAVMVLAVATPAVATEPADLSVSVGNTSYTVEVTHNGTPVNDTEVRVVPTDPNATYAGAAGVTDENGTVTFDLPDNETEVNISTTVEGMESSITYLLPASGHEDEPTWDGQGPFGQWVNRLVHNLLGSDANGLLGQIISDLVTKNNPGSEHRSDKANPGGNGNGPPDHAGPPDDGEDDDKGGPPDHAKNDKNNDDDGAQTQDADEDDEDEEESDDEDDGQGDGDNGNGKDK